MKYLFVLSFQIVLKKIKSKLNLKFLVIYLIIYIYTYMMMIIIMLLEPCLDDDGINLLLNFSKEGNYLLLSARKKIT